MKKNCLRLFALLICAGILWGMVPAEANATSLDGKRMPQMQTITYDPNMGGHYITEFVDLLQIASTAASNPDKSYQCYYQGGAPLVFFQDITLPKNLRVSILSKAVIDAEAIVELDGSMYCKELDVKGHLTVGEDSMLQIGKSASISGAVVLQGTLCIDEETSLMGFNRIYRAESSMIILECYFQDSDQLQQIADMAAINAGSWRYVVHPLRPEISLSSPVELPENVTLEMHYDDMVLTGAPLTCYGEVIFPAGGDCRVENDLTLYGDSEVSGFGEGTKITFEGTVRNCGYMSIYAPVVFKGAVENLEMIDVWYNMGGTMTFLQPQAYVDVQEDILGVICVNSKTEEFPDQAIQGMHVDDFRHVVYHDDWQTPYWALQGYQNSGDTHTHTAVVLPAVAPTCVEPGLTEGSKCSECGAVLKAQETVPATGHNWIDATCTAPKTCKTCGAAEGDALGHTEVIDKAVAATCSENGLTEGKHCGVCATVIAAQSVVPAKGHEDADHDYVCDVCGEDLCTEHEAKTVAGKAATCTEAGLTDGIKCAICEDILKAQEVIPAKGHTEVTDQAVAATCSKPGKTEGKHCSVCNTVIVAQKNIPAAAHAYDNGLDGTCNTCGIHRETTENRTVMHMFRMYDPNSGEHFYTGSVEERENLIAAGWNYEGVGFTFSRTTGLPVHRLYDPITGEHLYTMQQPVKTGTQYSSHDQHNGKDLYECEDRIWLYEGIAFNSAYDTEVPQYRLRNPNETRGAYHFTSSTVERDNLIAAGWIFEGICFYSSWK